MPDSRDPALRALKLIQGIHPDESDPQIIALSRLSGSDTGLMGSRDPHADLEEDEVELPGGGQLAIDDLNPDDPNYDRLMRKARPEVYERYRMHPEEFSNRPYMTEPRSTMGRDTFETRPMSEHRGPAMAQYDLFMQDWAEPRGTDPDLDSEEDRLLSNAQREAGLKGATVREVRIEAAPRRRR